MPDRLHDDAALNPGLAFARVGAGLYILWAILHLIAAFMVLGPATHGIEAGPALGRIWQNSAFMAIVSVATIWISGAFNWWNSAFGFWFNMYLVSAADIGFLVLIYANGWEPPPQALIGPGIWLCAAITSSIGYYRTRATAKETIVLSSANRAGDE